MLFHLVLSVMGDPFLKQLEILNETNQQPKPRHISSDSGDLVLDYIVSLVSKIVYPEETKNQPERLVHDVLLPVEELVDQDSIVAKKSKAIHELEHMNDPRAYSLLGDIFLFSKYQIQRNISRAFENYKRLSDLGDPVGLRMVGLMYATGLGVERDYPRALVYLNFAAEHNDAQALQTLGYWHHAGIGVPKKCDTSYFYYDQVADKSAQEWRTGPLGGKKTPRKRVILPDKKGGIYGKGASGGGNPTKQSQMSDVDLFLLYRLQAESGDASAQYLVGQFYYQGTQTTPPDFEKAHSFFLQASKQYPSPATLSQPDVPGHIKQQALAASQSAGYLGEMYARGEGVQQNLEVARKWFERGVAQDNGASYNGLGMMYLEGLGGLEVDTKLGLKYLNEAAQKGDVKGTFNLAEQLMQYEKKDWTRIVSLLQIAVKGGHPMAFYHLGKIYGSGRQGVQKNCKHAVSYLKSFVEKASWHDTSIPNALDAFLVGDYESSLVHYIFSAEKGYESSQVNAAWLLDSGVQQDPLPYSLLDQWDPYQMALPLWIRAANQGHADARVKVGDYFYYGLGTKKLPNKYHPIETQERPVLDKIGHWIQELFSGQEMVSPDYETAALHYQQAADQEQSSIAMYNLGFMHEHGLGVKQDFYLAKRMYDMALATNPGSYLVIGISLVKMNIKWTIESLFGTRKQEQQFEAPLPLDEDVDDQVVSIFKEMVFITILCVVAGYLLYQRQRLLNRP
ncbi:hypothetical protein EDD86DRAFT_211043 [Gorgonomyces haynaldii]|nr:hypothetical protein EDD86DRAFT_211043 [Gorgonomyces haynaldii]